VSWSDVDPTVRAAAEAACTDKQIDVLKLMAAGYSIRRIGRALDIDERTARDRRDRALNNVNEELARAAKEDEK
jgi:DNA-binding CsgD family transcriptional regulator